MAASQRRNNVANGLTGQAGEQGKSTPNQQSRRRDAILEGKGVRAVAGWVEGIWHGGTPSGKLEDGAAEMLHFTFIATDCCQCCLCVCVFVCMLHGKGVDGLTASLASPLSLWTIRRLGHVQQQQQQPR